MVRRDATARASKAQGRALRDAIEGAFEDLGGRAWLVSVAREHPNAFVTLLRALLAHEVNLGAQGPGEIRIRWSGELPSDPELEPRP
jgi:hypothetical protein